MRPLSLTSLRILGSRSSFPISSGTSLSVAVPVRNCWPFRRFVSSLPIARMSEMQTSMPELAPAFTQPPTSRTKLHGRDFYKSIGSPKMILAPMVDQSEFVRASTLLSHLTMPGLSRQ